MLPCGVRKVHSRAATAKGHGVKDLSLRTARRVVVAILGGSVTLLGICLLVLPGPAFVVIPIGLSILATEFVWAKTWLQKVKDMASQAASKVSGKKQS